MHVATVTCSIVHVPVRCHGDVDDGDGGGGVSWSVSYTADHHYCTCRTLQHTDGNIKMDFRNLFFYNKGGVIRTIKVRHNNTRKMISSGGASLRSWISCTPGDGFYL